MGIRPNGTLRVTEKETGGDRRRQILGKRKSAKRKAQSATAHKIEKISKADNNISIDDRAEAPTHNRSDAVDTASRRHNY